ncbi:MAG: trigger factor, partial [Dehalococcoidales bacterium]
MKTTREKTENHQAFLTIEMEPAEVEESLESAYRRVVKNARVPGFRKGKAPRAVLERYMGKDSLFEEAMNDLLPQVYDQAIKEQELETIAQPQIEIAQTDPVIFKAVVPLKPTVKLGDYQTIKVKPKPEKITQSNVDDVMEQLRHQHATWEPVERAVDYNDLVVMDVESNVEEQPFMNQKGAQYQVRLDQTYPAPGFAEQLIGMKIREEKEFTLKLPSEYPQEELAGKEASFKVKTTEIKQEVLPELNDDFAREVDTEIETLKALRERATSDMKLKAEERTRVEFEGQVIDAVVELSEIEFPPVLVDSEISRKLNQSFQGNQQSLENYLQNMNKTEEELQEELRPVATQNVIRSLVLGKVAEDGKIEVNDSEIDSEIDNMTKDSAEDKKDELKKVLDTPQVRQSIEQTLFTRKTMQLLKDFAQETKKTKRTR